MNFICPKTSLGNIFIIAIWGYFNKAPKKSPLLGAAAFLHLVTMFLIVFDSFSVLGDKTQLSWNKRNSNQNNIQIASAQVDLTKAFNKRWKLESGLKESYISKISDLKFENQLADGSWLSDPGYLNGFEFKENIAAAYSELRFKKNKVSARVGGRAELTNSEDIFE